MDRRCSPNRSFSWRLSQTPTKCNDVTICNEILFLFPFFFQPLKKVCLQTEILGNLFKYIFCCFILLFTSSSPCCKDQLAVLYISTSLIVLIQVYNWRSGTTHWFFCCGFDDILIMRAQPTENCCVEGSFSSAMIMRRLWVLISLAGEIRCFSGAMNEEKHLFTGYNFPFK